MAQVTNFNEAWQAYKEAHVNSDIMEFLPIFVKKYPKLISTANKAIKQQIEELGLANKKPAKAKKIVKLDKKDENKVAESVKNKPAKPDKTKPANKLSAKAKLKQPVDTSALSAVKREKKRRERQIISSKYSHSVLRDFPKALTQYAKREIDPDLSNTKAVASLLIALCDDKFTDQEVPSELLDLAKQYQHRNSQENILLLLKQTKRELNEVLHLNEQLVMLLSYFVSMSRWGFENDSGVNKISDIDQVDFAGQSVRELIQASRKVSDKLLTEKRQREGSNQRY